MLANNFKKNKNLGIKLIITYMIVLNCLVKLKHLKKVMNGIVINAKIMF